MIILAQSILFYPSSIVNMEESHYNSGIKQWRPYVYYRFSAYGERAIVPFMCSYSGFICNTIKFLHSGINELENA